MKCIRTVLIACATLLASAPALAKGFYFGASAGQSNIDVDINSFEASDTAFKAYGGYRFNDYIALEAFYADFGNADNGTLGIDATAYGAEVVTLVPLGDLVDLFGKLGAAHWDADFTGIGGFSDDGWDVTYGGGLAINVTRWLAIRAEWEMYEFETQPGFNVDTQLISAGLQFNF